MERRRLTSDHRGQSVF